MPRLESLDEVTVTASALADAWLAGNNVKSSPLNLLMQGKLNAKGALATADKSQTMFKPGGEL